MAKARLIARLDIKQRHLIKGIHLEGWRKVGVPHQAANAYYTEGIDELLYMDVVASLYGRNSLVELVEETARKLFVPLCVGGGVRSVGDADKLFRAGADKVAVNTAAIGNPDLLTSLAKRFGSQAVVLSIEAKGQGSCSWECYVDNGRERTGRDVVDWVSKAEDLGVGEILVTSIDRDGTRRGPEIELLMAVRAATNLPVIASGGIGTSAHVAQLLNGDLADAVALGTVLHYGDLTVSDIRKDLIVAGIDVRQGCK